VVIVNLQNEQRHKKFEPRLAVGVLFAVVPVITLCSLLNLRSQFIIRPKLFQVIALTLSSMNFISAALKLYLR